MAKPLPVSIPDPAANPANDNALRAAMAARKPSTFAIAATILKPVVWRVSSHEEWLAVVGRCADALTSLQESDGHAGDVDGLARTVLEPLRRTLGETEFAASCRQLADGMRDFCGDLGRDG